MFRKVFESVVDLDFIKVSRENWEKIEHLLANKDRKIKSLEAEVEKLSIYKEKDDILYSYEQELIRLRKENSRLKLDLSTATKTLKKANDTVQTVLDLENTYIKRIIKAELNSNIIERTVEYSYETKGDQLIKMYA